MSLKNLTAHFNPKVTPQSEAIPGRESEMKTNNAGGVTFTVDKWSRLHRFLILGAEGGSYHVGEKKLTVDNAKSVLECLKADGPRVVRTVVEISDAGRAPKNSPALFVLALAAKKGDEVTRAAALAALPKVARIGTHLFEFAEAVQTFGGWGRATQRAFSQWYTCRTPASLAMQLVKYQSREGWSHRDILRLSKPKGHERGGEIDRLLGWSTGKWRPEVTASTPDDATKLIWAFEMAKLLAPKDTAPTDASKATLASAFEKLGEAKLAVVTGGPGPKGGKVSNTTQIVNLINEFGLPRECIPTQFLNEVSVWAALLDNQGKGMPITALIRNLPKMTSIGLLTQSSDATKRVVGLLTDQDVITKGRVHPLAILVAMKTYASGHGVKGELSWAPVAKIVDALDKAFYLSFGNVDSTGKRFLLALDVSGSMAMAPIANMANLDCRTAAAAMALVTAASEPDTHIIGFCSGKNNFPTPKGWSTTWGGTQYNKGVSELDISPRRRLDDVVRSVSNLDMGGTDCALPMLYAMERNIKVDVFVIYTDCETWAGNIHPVQALRQYREKTGINARLIVCGMTATEFTIADPTDAGMLDVVGFDTAAPNVMAAFARGDF